MKFWKIRKSFEIKIIIILSSHIIGRIRYSFINLLLYVSNIYYIQGNLNFVFLKIIYLGDIIFLYIEKKFLILNMVVWHLIKKS